MHQKLTVPTTINPEKSLLWSSTQTQQLHIKETICSSWLYTCACAVGHCWNWTTPLYSEYFVRALCSISVLGTQVWGWQRIRNIYTSWIGLTTEGYKYLHQWALNSQYNASGEVTASIRMFMHQHFPRHCADSPVCIANWGMMRDPRSALNCSVAVCIASKASFRKAVRGACFWRPAANTPDHNKANTQHEHP